MSVITVFFLVTAAFFGETTATCVETYNMVCDDLDSKMVITANRPWLDLILKANYTDLVQFNIYDVCHLLQRYQSVTIIASINGIPNGGSFDVCTLTGLKTLRFHQNQLTEVGQTMFINMKLQTLSLANNSIEAVTKHALEAVEATNVDLSHNKIEALWGSTFHSRTTNIRIDNNSLRHIERGSFPKGLRRLSLKQNELSSIPNDVIGGLVNLTYLYLSHNKLFRTPNITNMVKLKVLDLSFNKLQSIEATFFSKLQLKILMLESNYIHAIDLSKGPFTHKHVVISLAFNKLQEVDTYRVNENSFEDLELVLYGNPLSCDVWNDIIKVVGKTSKCDSDFINWGNAPYCVASNASKHELERARNAFIFSAEALQGINTCLVNYYYNFLLF